MNYEPLFTLKEIKLKGLTNENVDERLLVVSVLRAQDIELADQIGKGFLRDLQTRKVANALTPAETDMLNEYVLPYLAICVDIRAINATSNRIMNAGTGKVNATEFQSNGNEDSRLFRNSLIADRDVLARDLVGHLNGNKSDFPLFKGFLVCENSGSDGSSFANSIFTI